MEPRVPTQYPGRYFIADIFSGVGIGKALDYLNNNFLGNGVLGQLQGTLFGHDSLEVQTEMFWTSDLPTQFLARRGYSVIPYLPALHSPRETSFNPLNPFWGVPIPPRDFDFNGDVGSRVRYDYERTLSDLYVERYLGTYTSWLHGHGMRSRAQVAYNYYALNMTRAGRAVDVPENESFDSGWGVPFDKTLPAYGTDRWRHVMDSYRLTGSGAHLGLGKRATLEFGDDFAAYAKQPVNYGQQLNEALAGGVTMGLLTSFSGVSTSWPVPSGLAVIGLGDSWTTAWPQWQNWPFLADYFARSTMVLEYGKPSVDVVIYHDKGLATVHEPDTPIFSSSKLESAGYTYEFIDPVALVSPDAGAVRGRLFGNGPSYRALVIDQESSLPSDAAQAILAYARNGLRVVVIGDPPSRTTGLKDADVQDAIVVKSMNKLLNLPNVKQVASEDDVAGALLRLLVLPSVTFGNSPLLTVHRQSANADLWWVFNPTDCDISTTGVFGATGTPHQLDLWNGTTANLAQWSALLGATAIPLEVPAHATTAIFFDRKEKGPVHVIWTNAEEALYDSSGLVLRDTNGGQKSALLSNGKLETVMLGSLPSSLGIDAWHLRVNEFSPSGYTTHDLDLAALADWRSIPEIADAVGSAVYSATVDVPADWLTQSRDVLLDVGEMDGAMQILVNGSLVTRQTTPGGRWSIKQFLQPGTNTLVVDLNTTLLNRMVQLKNSGLPPYQTGPTPLVSGPSGLIGPVRLIPAGEGSL